MHPAPIKCQRAIYRSAPVTIGLVQLAISSGYYRKYASWSCPYHDVLAQPTSFHPTDLYKSTVNLIRYISKTAYDSCAVDVGSSAERWDAHIKDSNVVPSTLSNLFISVWLLGAVNGDRFTSSSISRASILELFPYFLCSPRCPLNSLFGIPSVFSIYTLLESTLFWNCETGSATLVRSFKPIGRGE